MTWFGDLESHIIKEQFNTVSGRKSYNGSFIPINHEHLLIFKKNTIWSVPIKYTKDFTRDLKEMKNVTWNNLIQSTIQYLGRKATTSAIYEFLKDSEKAKTNNYVREKIRQVLNTKNVYYLNDNKVWQIAN